MACKTNKYHQLLFLHCSSKYSIERDNEPASGDNLNEIHVLNDISNLNKTKTQLRQSFSPAESPGTNPELAEPRKKSSFSGKSKSILKSISR